ncbi:MAG: SDR family NAD(P)-dependent oxidoreductase [Chloroflexi bacterium]|nr:SDR family NAD(P)-dependent oxidoreductase [Chloroflexota bacterium]
MNPANKVALITGAGLGLGRALALALARAGAVVAANDLTPINLDPLVAEIAAGGGRARAYEHDVSKKLDLQSLVNAVLDDFAQIDILVNHASVQPRQPLLDMDEWDWRRVTDVILTGTFLTTQSVGRVMREQGGGVILNIGPQDGGDFSGRRAAYLAAKAGVLVFSRAAAEELRPYNIVVHALEHEAGTLDAAVAEAMRLLGVGG